MRHRWYCFSRRPELGRWHALHELRTAYPNAVLIGCTTGGEIAGIDVHDGSIVVTAIEFSRTRIEFASETIDAMENSFAVGTRLGSALSRANLRGVFVLSDGTHVNGTDLVAGMRQVLGHDIAMTGGLAGDGPNFVTTRVGLNENPIAGRLAAIGLYGDAIRLGHGSFGGWDAVGPERAITRSSGNTLYDLDDQPALDLYKRYLGPEAANLPASALLCPLKIHPPGQPDASLVRTVVGIDERQNTMIFAGSIPQGHIAQIMLGHFDHLIGGAARAARQASIERPELAILVSCIGRKLLMGQRIGDEVEAVAEILDSGCRLTGFYSYGEIGPLEKSSFCDLHNQTMTITTMAET